MSLFNTLGRKVEEFKQQVTETAAETVTCEGCGTQFDADRDACPECGREPGEAE